ncbi:MAG: hypothetical protein OEO79_09245 [Gemmatimonadota bacterium]|nr:hypothetical protein [Gemmatimonadota bacterium]MDH3421934.1 hypothetical protein [Gemmatimonadota bacterium]
MPQVRFEELPDHGRLWVFPATRDLSDVEAAKCLEAVDDFLASWSAHGAALRSGRELLERRFLLVGVDVDAEAPSGCSIDALVNRLRGLGAELGVDLIDHAPVWYRAEGEIRSVPRAAFGQLAEQGQVGPEVTVVDTTLTSMRQLREGALERPATETWHGRAFFKSRAAG